jgi:hypothetical protein
MIPYILLPNYFKWPGLVLFISGFVLNGLLSPDLDNLSSGYALLVQLLILLGLLLLIGARQQMEDELVKHYRLVALQWAVLIYILLRAGFKTYAWYMQDASAYTEFGVNFLLETYLVIFYYFLFVKDRLTALFH